MAELSPAEKLRLKRELRRRKILDNAGNRLRFVSGQTKTLETETRLQTQVSDMDGDRRETSAGSCHADRLTRENERQDEKQTETTRLICPSINEFESNETTLAEAAGQSDVLSSGDATQKDDRKQVPYEFFLLSPFVRITIVVLAALTWTAQNRPAILHVETRPSWFGQSIVYGFLSLYIPVILVVISTRMRTLIGVKFFSKRTDLALAALAYASTFTSIPINVEKWMLWVFMLAYNTVTDMAATFFLFFLCIKLLKDAN